MLDTTSRASDNPRLGSLTRSRDRELSPADHRNLSCCHYHGGKLACTSKTKVTHIPYTAISPVYKTHASDPSLILIPLN